jgi:hypothetical protein
VSEHGEDDESGEESYREDEGDDETSDHHLSNCFVTESLSIYRVDDKQN